MLCPFGFAGLFIFALAHDAAADGTCGSKAVPMTEPFIGSWASDTGYSLQIRPTSWRHRWSDAVVDAAWADEEHKTFDDMARDEGKSSGEVIACIRLDLAAVSRLIASVRPYDATGATAARIRDALPNPPYQAIMAYYYEDLEYFVIVDAKHALDLWYGEGSIEIYSLTRKE